MYNCVIISYDLFVPRSIVAVLELCDYMSFLM